MRRLGFIILTVMVLALLWNLRQNQIANAPILPMRFNHQDHTEVNCILCHHNFVDDTGQDLCMDCHKRHVDIASEIEQMFHTFCRDCHVERQHEDLSSGPTRKCWGCHRNENLPWTLNNTSPNIKRLPHE